MRAFRLHPSIRGGAWALACCLIGAPAAAQHVEVSCRPADSELSIRYDAGEAPKVAARGNRIVEFERLVYPKHCPREGPCMVTDLKSRTLTCNLKGAALRMVFTPVPMNANRQGMCGGDVTGEVEIFRNGKPFVARTTFEPGACYHEEEPYISTIRISPKMETAEIVREQRKQ